MIHRGSVRGIASAWLLLVAAALLHGAPTGYAQETPPAPPPPAQPPPAQPPPAPPAMPPSQDPASEADDIVYEKYRYEKDGFVTIFYRVGHERGKILKAILEGTQLVVPGRAVPSVTTTPNNPRSRVLSPEGWVLETENLHLLIVSDRKEHIKFIESVLKALDVPDPQIVVEARVVELRLDKDFQYGLEGDLTATATAWINNASSQAFFREIRARYSPTEALTGGAFQGSGFRFSRTSAHQGSIGALLQMFVQNGKAEILSNPRVVVQSGQQAIMSAGEDIPYFETVLHPGGSTTTVKYKPTGVTLNVKPHIVGASNIHLELTVDVTALLGFVTGPTGTAPSFTTRKVNTQMAVHDGDEVVLGGLTRREVTKNRRGLPILSDIPLIGWLFGRWEEAQVVQEILFFIRPMILQGKRPSPPPVIDPDRKNR